MGVMYQMRPCEGCPALFKAKVPHLSGIHKINHAHPE